MNYSQKNIELLFRLIGSIDGQKYSTGEYFDCITTQHSIWPNQLINLKASAGNIDSILDHLEEESAKNLVPSLFMLNPVEDKNFYVDTFKKRAYASSVWTAMAHDLKSVDAHNAIDNFQIGIVNTKKELRAWLTIAETELMGNHPLNETIFTGLMNTEGCFFFLGLKDGQPVATSFLYCTENHSGIYLVSTDKEHRKQGLGKAMTLVSLQKAKAFSCERVDIQATDLGKNVYKSLGFVERGNIHVFRIKKSAK